MGNKLKEILDAGNLVPDEITIRMLLARLAADDARAGAILDGFPRNRTQAEALDRALAAQGGRVDHALSIEVPEDELVRRLSGRWICAKAGHVYNEQTNPPKVAGRCDLDGSDLIQRVDDRADTIRIRLAEQLGALADVVDHYRSTGVLRSVDGTGPIESVTAGLLAGLGGAGTAAEAASHTTPDGAA